MTRRSDETLLRTEASQAPYPRVGGTDHVAGFSHFRLTSAISGHVSIVQRLFRPGTRRFLTAASAVFVVSLFFGNALAGPPPGHFYPRATGPTLSVAYEGLSTEFEFNVTGGAVSSLNVGNYYHLFWFFGGANASGALGLVADAVKPPASCTSISTNCTITIPVFENYTYNRSGSFEVSVTVYDGALDYTTYSFLVNVYAAPLSVKFMCAPSPPPNPANLVLEGANEEFWAQGVITGTGIAYPGLIYTYAWGDGTTSRGIHLGGCFGAAADGFSQHRWNESGSYLVTVTGVDPNTGAAARGFLFVNVSNIIYSYGYAGGGPSFSSVNFPTTGTVGVPVPVSAAVTDPVMADYSGLNVIWNFGNHYVVESSAANGTSYSSVVYLSPAVYTWTATVQDEEGATRVTTGSITITSAGGSKTPPTVTGTTGTNEMLTASSLTTVSNVVPNLNDTWRSRGATTWGSEAEVNSFYPGTHSTGVWINRSGYGVVASNTQPITWSNPSPTAGIFDLYTLPNITIQAKGAAFNMISETLYLHNSPLETDAFMPGMGTITLPPLPEYLGFSYTVQATYYPNSSFPTGSTWAWFNFTFPGNNTPVSIPMLFFNSHGPWTWGGSVTSFAQGQPIDVQLSAFSPADTALNTSLKFGDGTTAWLNTTTHTALAPTLITRDLRHTWRGGASYNLVLTSSDGFHSVSDLVKLTDTSSPTINDSAPQYSFTPSTVAEGTNISFTANPLLSAPTFGQSTLTWSFGDGVTATGSNVHHVYVHPGHYPVVLRESSATHSTQAIWHWVNISNPAPIARFSINPSSPTADEVVTVNANASLDTPNQLGNLSYYWNWGDGNQSGGLGPLAATQTHVYHSQGSYSITLTVLDSGGMNATLTKSVTVSALTLGGSLPSRTVLAGTGYAFTPTLTGLNGTSLTSLNVTWTWGDSTSVVNPFPTQWDVTCQYGFGANHTYLAPGKYNQSVSLYDPLASPRTTVTYSAWITVIDPAPLLVDPYQNGIVYGMNHTSSFTVYVLGTFADNPVQPGQKWNFTWNYGDGSSPVTHHRTVPNDTVSHSYLGGGQVVLTTSVTSPWPPAYRSSAMLAATITEIPDWDGDGLPNAYEMLVSHTNPGLVQTAGAVGDQGPTGYGLTDFLNLRLGSLNLSADVDNDGLTTIQELLGSVTGYPSNPLDPNTAGDGIADGAHRFSDVFSASQVVPIPANPNPSDLYVPINIPNVTYSGIPPAFNSSELAVEFNVTPTSSMSGFSLTLYTGPKNAFSLPLSTTSNIDNYYLLNNTPLGGLEGTYGLGWNDIYQSGTWELVLDIPAWSTVTGSIVGASVTFAYYTDPVHADPLFQGLLQGHGLTTAIYNCSAPKNETYPSYNFGTMVFTNQTFWPYTETYYKLSVQQGVPYVGGWDSTIATANNNSGACPAGFSTLAGHTAGYLGDGDFGISPWNTHAAGDPALTNGMKALGATNYTLSAGLYESYNSVPAGQMVAAPTYGKYAPDPLVSSTNPDDKLPLNPTAPSSAGTGVLDSVAPDPLYAYGLAVTITGAQDPTCYTLGITIPVEQVSVTTTNAAGASATIYTPSSAGGTGHAACGFGTISYAYAYNSHYTVAVDNSQSSWSLTFNLYDSVNGIPWVTSSSSLATDTLTGSWTPYSTVSFSSSSDFTASAEVVPIQRASLILVNSSGEAEKLPGYGYRYIGEQKFNLFTVDVGGTPPTGFGANLNVILESRSAFEYSPLNNTIVTNPSSSNLPSSLNCLGSAMTTGRDVTKSSSAAVENTWSVNLSTNPNCASSTLLPALLTVNSTGVTIGTAHLLNTIGVDRLGLGPSALFLIPLLPISGYNGQEGSAPQSIWSLASQAAQVIWHALVAGYQYLAHAAQQAVSAFNQAVLGALNAVVQVGEIIAKAAAAAFNWILTKVEAIFSQAMSDAMSSASAQVVTKSPSPDPTNAVLSLAVNQGVISGSDYTNKYDKVSPNPQPAESSAAVSTNLDEIIGTIMGIAVGIGLGIALANIASDAASFGTVPALIPLLKALISKNAEQDLVSKIGLVLNAVGMTATIALQAAIQSGSVSGTTAAAKTLGFGAVAAGLVGNSIGFMTAFNLWKIAAGNPLASAVALPLLLAVMSLILAWITYALQKAHYTMDNITLILAVLGLILAAAGLAFTFTPTYNAIAIVLFPMDLATQGLLWYGFFASAATALTADNCQVKCN